MEKTNWGKIVLEVLITVFITSLFTFLLSSFVKSNQCDISIGTSIINSNEVMTPITIKNNSKNKKIEDFDLSVGEYNYIINAISNLSILIDNDKNVITLKYIPPNDTISLILITNKIVDLDTIKIAYDGNINTTYLENKKDIYELITIQAFLYGLMLFAFKYLSEKINKKHMVKLEEVKETLDKNEKEINKLLEEQKEFKEENNQIKIDRHKLRIYYLTRMKDYKKELEFWKDTIRKYIYLSSGLNKKNSEKLFEIVTKTLKTYGTKSSETNIDEIFYLANMMNANNQEKDMEL